MPFGGDRMRGGDVTRSIVLVILAAAAIAAVATVVPRFSGGTERAEATDGASLALDMDITNGSGPCNPIDSERAISGDGAEYKVAICLTGATAPPAALNIDLLYDDTLDQCVPVDCPEGIGCLDTNPDANGGTTAWTTPGLGDDCDCSIGGEKPPVCDDDPATGPDKGVAYIDCYCATATLPVGEGVSSPIAVVNFKNIAKGRATFTLGTTTALYSQDGENILKCAVTPEDCIGGTRGELAPTSPTPTAAAVPPTGTPNASGTPVPAGPAATAAAATAIALGTPPSALTTPAGTTTPGAKKTPSGSPTARPSATPGEEKGEGEGGGTNAGVIAVIVIGAVVVVGGAGWFAWRRLRLR
jgi:hypothetical protein